MNEAKDIERKVRDQIDALEKRLADLHARLPAHSIPPAMEEELEEQGKNLFAMPLYLKVLVIREKKE